MTRQILTTQDEADIVSALSPNFLGSPQESLIASIDIGAKTAYDQMYDYTTGLYGSTASAEQSAIEAADSAESAAVSASEAAASATSAQEAQVAAETARDAAQLSAGIYPDTTTGLAAVADGEYFSVPSADSDEYLILYRRTDASTATEVKRYPAASIVQTIESETTNYRASGDPIGQDSPPGYAFTINDGAGRAAGGVTDDGTLSFATAEFDEVTSDEVVVGDTTLESARGVFAWCVTDSDGNVAIGVDNDGVVHIKDALVNSTTIRSRLPVDFSITDAAEINHVISYGQSLAIGSNNTAMSKVAYGDTLMFAGGVRPSDAGSTNEIKYASLLPLVESDHNGLGETPVFGSCQSFRDLLANENGVPVAFPGYTLLGSAPGEGGQPISALTYGTSIYNRMIDDIEFGLSLSSAEDKTYRCVAMFWTQGEADYSAGTSKTTYKTALTDLFTHFKTDAITASGQANAPLFITYQCASHLRYVYNSVPSAANCAIALAQLEFANENSGAYMACPMYQFDYAAGGFDNPHLSSASSKVLGAYYGLACKRVLVDEVDWSPVRPIATAVSGSIVRVTFHVPVKPLVIDTDWVTENANYGFNLYESDGTTEITINSVEVCGVDKVKITAASTIPAGAILRYAFKTNNGGHCGRVDGARGNVRDSQGDYIIFDPDGINRPLHNWCVIFEETL